MDDGEVTVAVRALVGYLRVNRLACDTADGIATWWLGSDDPVSKHALARALTLLTRQGVLEELTASDGRRRYRRCCDNETLDAAFAALSASLPRVRH